MNDNILSDYNKISAEPVFGTRLWRDRGDPAKNKACTGNNQRMPSMHSNDKMFGSKAAFQST